MASEVAEQNETADRSRAMDTELLALGRILRILEELTEGGQRRAAMYLHDRYSVSVEGGLP